MISVIIPVYNAEDYLSEAILSVFSQTFEDWELILIDDGSTDSSPYICDLQAKKNSKVKVFHTPNRGVSHARNLGIEMAAGDYIYFLDADDLLPPDALAILMDIAIKTRADVVCGGIKNFYTSDSRYRASTLPPQVSNPFPHVRTITPVAAATAALYQKGVDNSVWGKLYSSRIWASLRFKEGIRYEDLEICHKILLAARLIAIVTAPLYFYRQHPGSYIHTFTLKRADVLSVTNEIVEYASDNVPLLLPAARSRQLSANFNIFGLIAANRKNNGFLLKDNDETQKLEERCWNKIKELRGESLRNPKVRLKNKVGIIVSYLFGRKGLEYLSRIVYRN